MSQQRLSTGASGLDEILRGGLIVEGAYLVRGCPGIGKTGSLKFKPTIFSP